LAKVLYFSKSHYVFARRALALFDEAIPPVIRRLLRQNQERLAATWEVVFTQVLIAATALAQSDIDIVIY